VINKKNKTKHERETMNNKFDELTKQMAQSVTSRGAFKKLGVGLAGLALAGFLVLPSMADQPAQTSTVLDPAGDAVFPNGLYGAPVPPYLDMVRVSVSYSRAIFHFEVQMNAPIPANPSPDFTTAPNHLGAVFGVLTDRKTASQGFNFFGQNDSYSFNLLVGAVYFFADGGDGLPLGWTGFLLDLNTSAVVALPMKIQGDTVSFETSAASLGNPSSFLWAATSECHSAPETEEKNKSQIMADFAPDHDYASWPAQ
jgi:hypothetical protein